MDALTEPLGMTDEHTVRESKAGEVRSGRGRSRIVIDRAAPPTEVTSRVGQSTPAATMARATRPDGAVEIGAAIE
jgi:hypothetical protein